MKKELLIGVLAISTMFGTVTDLNSAKAKNKGQKIKISKVKRIKAKKVRISSKALKREYAFQSNLKTRAFKLNRFKNHTLYATKYVKVTPKKSTFYYVTSSNKRQHGWVNKKALIFKANKAKSDDYYKNLANQMTKDARKKTTDANKGSKTNTNSGTKTNTNTNNSGSKTPTKTPSVPKMSEAQYNSEVASAFLSQLNVERTKRGLAPAVMTAGSETQQIAEGRIPQLLSQQTAGGSAVLNHYYGGHLAPMALAKQLGYKGVVPSESLAGKWANDGSDVTTGTLPSDLGKELVHMLIYEDSASGNGHRATLLAADYTHVGIAVGQASGKVVLVSEHSAK